MNSERRVYGVVGYPVKHSLSPKMHNAAFKALKIDATYELFEVKPQDLNSFLGSLSGKNICGLNVTIPHKENVVNFVKFDSQSSCASQIRAVNTMLRKDSAWFGFNTDSPGFLQHLREGIDPLGKKVVLLGAGGAGKAIAYALASSGVKAIDIYDIDKEKSRNLVFMVKNLFKNADIKSVNSVEELGISDKDLLVNSTPVGMKETDSCLIDQEMLHKNIFVYDVIYNPKETKLLKLAKKVGAKTSNGLGMLLHQGMLSFEIWTDKKAPKEIMWKALNLQI
jgi:shikimate dehydrogenase